jgi:hypothetical protein
MSGDQEGRARQLKQAEYSQGYVHVVFDRHVQNEIKYGTYSRQGASLNRHFG